MIVCSFVAVKNSFVLLWQLLKVFYLFCFSYLCPMFLENRENKVHFLLHSITVCEHISKVLSNVKCFFVFMFGTCIFLGSGDTMLKAILHIGEVPFCLLKKKRKEKETIKKRKRNLVVWHRKQKKPCAARNPLFFGAVVFSASSVQIFFPQVLKHFYFAFRNPVLIVITVACTIPRSFDSIWVRS